MILYTVAIFFAGAIAGVLTTAGFMHYHRPWIYQSIHGKH